MDVELVDLVNMLLNTCTNVLQESHNKRDGSHRGNLILKLSSILEDLLDHLKDHLNWCLAVDVGIDYFLGSLDHEVNDADGSHRKVVVHETLVFKVALDNGVKEAPHSWGDLVLVVEKLSNAVETFFGLGLLVLVNGKLE